MDANERLVLCELVEGLAELGARFEGLAGALKGRLEGMAAEAEAADDPRLRGLEALPQYTTIKAVARVLGVHPNTVSARVKDGTYRADYVGVRSVRVHRSSVVAALRDKGYVVRR